jgi:hypothetical protein
MSSVDVLIACQLMKLKTMLTNVTVVVVMNVLVSVSVKGVYTTAVAMATVIVGNSTDEQNAEASAA